MSKKKTPEFSEPQVGDTFEHLCHGELYTLTVVSTDEGIRYRIDQFPDMVFTSLTTAAKWLVPDGQSVNGRRYWRKMVK